MKKFELPALPYDYKALEPHIDSRTMEIHHTKHHQAYVDNLNKALEGLPQLQGLNLEDLLTKIKDVPEASRQAIINHGGGHANHSLFWTLMAPQAGGAPSGALSESLRKAFGSFDKFKEEFGKAAMGRFGSGWAWLVKDQAGKLSIISTPNQDSPLMLGLTPVLGLDVWEHAYYLKYQNKRADYVAAWWNVVNWKNVAARLE